MNKVCCPYCSTKLEWSDEIDHTFNGKSISIVDIYTCSKCLKDFEIQTEFAITPKNYQIISEL